MNAQKEPDHKTDFSRVPDSVLGELVRQEALRDCELHVVSPDGVDIPNQWDLLREATVNTTEWIPEDAELNVFYETTTTVEREKYPSTRNDPAAFETFEFEVMISATWSMDAHENPVVDIEVYE